jgi:hypothetical protein
MERKEMILRDVEALGAFQEEMMATPELRDYMNRVFTLLIDLNPGDSIEIDRICRPASIRRFIGCACTYFWITGCNKIEFDNEIRIIKKM